MHAPAIPTIQGFAAVRDTASLLEAVTESRAGNGSLFQHGRSVIWMRETPSCRQFEFTFRTPQLAAAALANAKAAAHLEGGAS